MIFKCIKSFFLFVQRLLWSIERTIVIVFLFEFSFHKIRVKYKYRIYYSIYKIDQIFSKCSTCTTMYFYKLIVYYLCHIKRMHSMLLCLFSIKREDRFSSVLATLLLVQVKINSKNANRRTNGSKVCCVWNRSLRVKRRLLVVSPVVKSVTM